MLPTAAIFALAFFLKIVSTTKTFHKSIRTSNATSATMRPFETMLVNNTACEKFAQNVEFEMERAIGRWHLVYVSPSSERRCRWMELTRVASSEAIPWVNSVRWLVKGVPLSLDLIDYKLHHLFGAGSVLLENRYGPGAMVFLPSLAALRARAMPRGMTLQLQFKSARDYEYVALMFCDTEAVYLLARGLPEPQRIIQVAREMGVPAQGRLLCDVTNVKNVTSWKPTIFPLRKAY